MTQHPHRDEDRHYTTQPAKNQDPDTDDYGEPLPFFLTRRGMITASVAILAISGAALAENLPTWIHNAQATGTTPSPSVTSAARTTEAASTSPVPKATISDKPEANEDKYVPAHAYAPARNVPVPKRPEGMDDQDVTGFRKTVSYWAERTNYGTQTGDFSVMEGMVSKDVKQKWEYYDDMTDLYKSGGWAVNGINNYEFLGDPYLAQILPEHHAADDEYVWYFKVRWEFVGYVEADGSTEEHQAKDSEKEGALWRVFGKYDMSKKRWILTRIERA